jgi:hypothetical protein
LDNSEARMRKGTAEGALWRWGCEFTQEEKQKVKE